MGNETSTQAPECGSKYAEQKTENEKGSEHSEKVLKTRQTDRTHRPTVEEK